VSTQIDHRHAAGASLAEYGLGLLGTLTSLLEEAIGVGNLTPNQLSAASALAQKAGAYIEKGLRGLDIIDGPGLRGSPEMWLGIDELEEVTE
jgi:hypothetical protein